MMKISDYKFAEYFIRNICKHHGCSFVDLSISVGGKGYQNGKILIEENNKFGKTIFQIVSTYVEHADLISGAKLEISPSEKTMFYNMVVSVLRDLTYSKKSLPIPEKFNSIPSRINRSHFIWTVMKNIVCPSFDKPFKNTKLVYGKTSYIDGAKYLTSQDIPNTDEDYFPFIFCNLEIENEATRDAFVFYEALRANEFDPRGIVHEIFTKQELWNKFYQTAKLAFPLDDDLNNFLTTLSIISNEMGSNDKRVKKVKENKYAQFGFGNSTWWYFGLLEKLLEPSRGSDWSAYETLKPVTEELWNKIEDEKKRRGMKELPLEILLRIQSEEFRQQPDLIIQGLLADDRIW